MASQPMTKHPNSERWSWMCVWLMEGFGPVTQTPHTHRTSSGPKILMTQDNIHQQKMPKIPGTDSLSQIRNILNLPQGEGPEQIVVWHQKLKAIEEILNQQDGITDTQALDLIHEIMLAEQWKPNAWAEIADVLRGTGREL